MAREIDVYLLRSQKQYRGRGKTLLNLSELAGK